MLKKIHNISNPTINYLLLIYCTNDTSPKAAWKTRPVSDLATSAITRFKPISISRSIVIPTMGIPNVGELDDRSRTDMGGQSSALVMANSDITMGRVHPEQAVFLLFAESVLVA